MCLVMHTENQKIKDGNLHVRAELCQEHAHIRVENRKSLLHLIHSLKLIIFPSLYHRKKSNDMLLQSRNAQSMSYKITPESKLMQNEVQMESPFIMVIDLLFFTGRPQAQQEEAVKCSGHVSFYLNIY